MKSQFSELSDMNKRHSYGRNTGFRTMFVMVVVLLGLLLLTMVAKESFMPLYAASYHLVSDKYPYEENAKDAIRQRIDAMIRAHEGLNYAVKSPRDNAGVEPQAFGLEITGYQGSTNELLFEWPILVRKGRNASTSLYTVGCTLEEHSACRIISATPYSGGEKSFKIPLN